MIVKPHPLKGPNRFKLGVFSANADGGLAITDVAERWRARWDDNLNAVPQPTPPQAAVFPPTAVVPYKFPARSATSAFGRAPSAQLRSEQKR